jgi:hypothetical protein
MVHVVSVSLGSSKRDTDQVIEMLGARCASSDAASTATWRPRRADRASSTARRRHRARRDRPLPAWGAAATTSATRAAWPARRHGRRSCAAPASSTRSSAARSRCSRRASAGGDRRVLMTAPSTASAWPRRSCATAPTVALRRPGVRPRRPDPGALPSGARRGRRTLAPIVVQVPVKWLYDTGAKQDRATPRTSATRASTAGPR